MENDNKIEELANTLFSKGLAASMWDARNKARDILGISQQVIEQLNAAAPKRKESVATPESSTKAGIKVFQKDEKDMTVDIESRDIKPELKPEAEVLTNKQDIDKLNALFANSVEGASPDMTVFEAVNLDSEQTSDLEPRNIATDEVNQPQKEEICEDIQENFEQPIDEPSSSDEETAETQVGEGFSDSYYIDESEIIPPATEASGQSPLSTLESGMISEHAQKPPNSQKRQNDMQPSQRAVFDEQTNENVAEMDRKDQPYDSELYEQKAEEISSDLQTSDKEEAIDRQDKVLIPEDDEYITISENANTKDLLEETEEKIPKIIEEEFNEESSDKEPTVEVLEIIPLATEASGQSPLSTLESGMISEHAQKPLNSQKRQNDMQPSQRAVFDEYSEDNIFSEIDKNKYEEENDKDNSQEDSEEEN